MDKNQDFLKHLFDSFFKRNESSYYSISSFGSFGLSDETDSSFPKEGDKNFNKTEEVTETETHTIKKEVWTRIDGTQRFERTTRESKSKKVQPSKEQLEQELKEAIAAQKYEKACVIRDELKKLE